MIFPSQQERAQLLRARVRPELVSVLASRLLEILDGEAVRG